MVGPEYRRPDPKPVDHFHYQVGPSEANSIADLPWWQVFNDKALQSLMGGSSDVASGAYSNTLTMAAKGQRLIYFVTGVRYPALAIGVAKRIADRYKSPADLKGMKIGVSAPGSSTHMIVAHLLGKGGLTSNDVSIIGVGTSAGAVAAVEKGEIDAIINSDPVMAKLETDIFPQVKELLKRYNPRWGESGPEGGNEPGSLELPLPGVLGVPSIAMVRSISAR